MSRTPGSLRAIWRRIRAVALKELRQLSRDPLTLGFVVAIPIGQVLLFGYAIDQDVRDVQTAVVDHSDSSISRRIVGQLEATQTFEVVERLASQQEAQRRLVSGAIDVAIVIPKDFDRAYYRGRGAQMSLMVNATDPVMARAVRASANGLFERLNQELQPRGGDGTARPSALDGESFYARPELIHDRHLEVAILTYYNPELRTAVFVVPALLGVILTTTMILMTSVAIVRERERGTFEFLIATPVRRFELMTGKILPYIGIGVVQVVLVLVAGVSLFQVPIRGSLLDLFVASMAFIAANLSLGLVISSRTTSQLQATQISFFFFLPSVLLSGFMFPFDTMPRVIQWLGETLPLTHYIRIVKGILLRGAPLTDLWVDLGAMVLFFALGMFVATRTFRKNLG